MMNDNPPSDVQQHRDLLEKYRRTQTGTGWHTAPDDGYLYDHLASHLKEAGLVNELEALFATPEWMKARLAQNDYIYNKYLDDLELAWQIAIDELQQQLDRGDGLYSFAKCVRYLLIKTTINSIAAQQPPALLARAVELGVWSVERALATAKKHVSETMLAAILGTGKLSQKQHEEFRDIGFEITRYWRDHWQDVQYPFDSVWLYLRYLVQLIPYFTEEQRAETLKTDMAHLLGKGWHKTDWRVEALEKIALYLTQDQLQAVIAAVSEVIYNDKRDVEMLSAVVPYLASPLQQQIIQRILDLIQVHPECLYNSSSLARIMPFLTPSQKQDALKLGIQQAHTIEVPNWRVSALIRLIPHVPNNTRDGFVEHILSLIDQLEYSQEYEWLKLFPYLNAQQRKVVSPKLFPKLIQPESGYRPANILVEIFPLLTETEKTNALEVAYRDAIATNDKYYRQHLLDDLAPCMTEEYVQHSLDVVQEVKNDTSIRHRTIAGLIPMMTENKRQAMGQWASNPQQRKPAAPQNSAPLEGEALARAYEKTMREPNFLLPRAEALAAMLPRLDSIRQQEAVRQIYKAYKSMKFDSYYGKLFQSIVSFLPEDLRQQAIETALHHDHPDDGVFMLCQIIPHLSEPQKSEVSQAAFGLAMRMKNEAYRRARVLLQLASALSGELQYTTIQQAYDDLVIDKSKYEFDRTWLEVYALLFAYPSYYDVALKTLQQRLLDYILTINTHWIHTTLDLCADLATIGVAVLPQETYGDIADTIIDICDTWNWT